MITLTWKWSRAGGIAELRCGYCGSATMPLLIKRTAGSMWKEYSNHIKKHAGRNGPQSKSEDLAKSEAIARAKRHPQRQYTNSGPSGPPTF